MTVFAGVAEPACRRQVGSGVKMFFVYAIESLNRNYIYVGITNDLQRRVSEHNDGYNKTTRPYAPFKLIYYEEFVTRSDARNREKYLKSGIGKEFLRKIG